MLSVIDYTHKKTILLRKVMDSLIFQPHRKVDASSTIPILCEGGGNLLDYNHKASLEVPCSALDGKLKNLLVKINSIKENIDEMISWDYTTQVYYRTELILNGSEHATLSHIVRTNLVAAATHKIGGSEEKVDLSRGGSGAIAQLTAQHNLNRSDVTINIVLLIPISIEDENVAGDDECEFVLSEQVEQEFLTLQRMLLAKGNKQHSLDRITTHTARNLRQTSQVH